MTASDQPWKDGPLLPGADDEGSDIPLLARSKSQICILVLVLATTQVFAALSLAPGRFSAAESEYLGYVMQVAVELSVLVLTLTPAMIALLIQVTSRQDRAISFLRSPRQHYRRIWSMFVPVMWAIITLFVVLAFGFVPLIFDNPALSGVYASGVVVLLYIQAIWIYLNLLSLREQVADESSDDAKDLMNAASQSMAGVCQDSPEKGGRGF